MTKKLNETSAERSLGIWYAIAAYTAWGILPLYWKALKVVPAIEILANRLLWSCIFVVGIIFFTKGWQDIVKAVSVKRNRILVSLCSLLISVNWFTYIWAVNAGRVVETSMGYYINPLISVLLAVLVLKERLTLWQTISLILAFVGVSIMALSYGKIPWVALTLAVSFGFYGLFKKMAHLSAITSLALETMLIAPIALVYLSAKGVQGTGAFGTVSLSITLLLVLSGVVTAVPLLWFAQGTRRIPLSTMGFIQYLSPTITLFLGVFVYKEPFTHVHAVSFSFIWSALALYSISGILVLRNRQSRLLRSDQR